MQTNYNEIRPDAMVPGRFLLRARADFLARNAMLLLATALVAYTCMPTELT